jgi:hypothetical protein
VGFKFSRRQNQICSATFLSRVSGDLNVAVCFSWMCRKSVTIDIHTSFEAVFLRRCRFDVRGVCDSPCGDLPFSQGLRPKLAAQPQELGGNAFGTASEFHIPCNSF